MCEVKSSRLNLIESTSSRLGVILASSGITFLTSATLRPRDNRFHFTISVALSSPYLTPVEYRIWEEMQQRLYQTKVRNVDELKQRMSGVSWSKAWSMTQKMTQTSPCVCSCQMRICKHSRLKSRNILTCDFIVLWTLKVNRYIFVLNSVQNSD